MNREEYIAIDGRSFADVLCGRGTAHRDTIFTTHSGDGRMNVYAIRALLAEPASYAPVTNQPSVTVPARRSQRIDQARP